MKSSPGTAEPGGLSPATPSPSLERSVEQDLLLKLNALETCVVAFSGGTDSALVLAAAVRALGPANVIAATAVSGSLARVELSGAQELAASLGVEHLTPETHEMNVTGYRANAGNRCYFCKSELLDVLTDLAAQRGFRHVVTGTNADDGRDPFRTGIRAADERGVIAPLRDVGMTKQMVRDLARTWGIPVWDKPAAPCLASRIAYGVEVTPERLKRVERAEHDVRAMLAESGVPVSNLRVRDLGRSVRVEVDESTLEDTNFPSSEIVSAVRSAGFDDVPVDLSPFKSGSLNALLQIGGRPAT